MTGSSVMDNSIGAAVGGEGGIFDWPGSGAVTLDTGSSVTGSSPDDCVGTTAC